jgi:pimeloyl-ACP methyl ester carboxylesterase
MSRARGVRSATGIAGAAGLFAFLASQPALGAAPAPHDAVETAGATEVAGAELRPSGGSWRSVTWDELGGMRLTPGSYELRTSVDASADDRALDLPPCAGLRTTTLDGHKVERSAAGAPVVVPVTKGSHVVVLSLAVSRYEGRVACGYRPRVGARTQSVEGLAEMTFESPHHASGGGHAVVYVPAGHDLGRPSALLVGAHPWNGTIWTYAAYASLLRTAAARDVVLLMPSGLGNSLYTADAEDEVLRAIDGLGERLAIDRRRVSIWGASMGGAGATTIGLHNPDMFAGITSFFGDSKYDLSTYVRSLLVDERGAHLINALDIVENARNVPVWLVHGEEDHTSPIRQSEILAEALTQRRFAVRFDRVPGAGHSGALVERFVAEVVERAAIARVAEVTRVTYRSVTGSQRGAYGVQLERESPAGDAFVDVERRSDGVHVRSADGVRAIEIAPGALGLPLTGPRPPLLVDCAAPGLRVTWGAPP